MQLDDPARGFSVKLEGPLDMRMNPGRGLAAGAWLAKASRETLAAALDENADEPHAQVLAGALAGGSFGTTTALAGAIRAALAGIREVEPELVIRRVFQAIRIAVNDEFSALEHLLRCLPGCLRPGGRAAVLSFHSGEDRRVKRAFEAGLAGGLYEAIAPEPGRPGPEERVANPRSASAKLRWARRSGLVG